MFFALSAGDFAVSLNHFQLHKRLPGSPWRLLFSEASQPENASLPACCAGPWRLRGRGREPPHPRPRAGAAGQECLARGRPDPSDSSGPLVCPPPHGSLGRTQKRGSRLEQTKEGGEASRTFPALLTQNSQPPERPDIRRVTRGGWLGAGGAPPPSGEWVKDANSPLWCPVALRSFRVSPKQM